MDYVPDDNFVVFDTVLNEKPVKFALNMRDRLETLYADGSDIDFDSLDDQEGYYIENIPHPTDISDYEFDGTYFFFRYGDYLLRQRAYLIA